MSTQRRPLADAQRRRRAPIVVLGLSLCVLIAAPTGWALTRDQGAGAEGVDAFAATDGTQDPQASDALTSNRGTIQRLERLSPSSTPPVVAPALFQIPSLGIATEVRTVGVRSDGQVAIPDDGDLVGWYRFSAGAGAATGSTVIVGHRDTRAQGPGVLFTLGSIKVGDVVTIYREDWKRVAYRVSSVQAYRKTVLPVDALFATSGAPRLTIITCGGAYTRGRGYDDNIVVTAAPTGA